MRGCDEGKIKTHIDCRGVWELLVADKLKLSQFEGHRGLIIKKLLDQKLRLMLNLSMCM